MGEGHTNLQEAAELVPGYNPGAEREEGEGERETGSSHQLVIADGQVSHLAPVDQDNVEAALGLPAIDS